MKVDVGIIGGTGVGDRLTELGGSPVHVPTPWGMLRGALLKHQGLRLFAVQRHSLGHKTPPHKVNYAAMADGLRRLGAKGCLSTAAVGSLNPSIGVGTFCVCSDFIDLTARNLTLFESKVEHTDFSVPMGVRARDALLSACKSAGIKIPERAVYVCTNGPRYETPFEVSTYAHLKGDVVGMTAASEAILMREAGVDHACLAIVTNMAAGVSSEPLSHQEVVEQMAASGPRAIELLLEAAKRLSK